MRVRIAAIAAALLLAGAAGAVEPGERLADPALEARARALSQELRCLVCQNQSIDDSSATLARDLRLLVRERLAAGDDDGAVKAYLVARYGDFVLLRPPLKPATWALWAAPPVLLAVGLVIIFLARRRRRAAGPAAAPLSPAERARLAALLGERRGDGGA
ncbi:MAG: cytochrome c-type biogenesis protein CcmH [Alphaproteobacteria bacterium]|nr:cytochrome c-type biogenesis protein CcmH [Alphaproteobacteria bacterium]